MAAVYVFNWSLNAYGGYKASSDLSTIYEQSVGHKTMSDVQGVLVIREKESVFEKAYLDIQKASESGMLKTLMTYELDQVFNYVLYGGNGDESKKVLNLAREILNKYSSAEAVSRLRINNLIKKIKNESSENNQESCGSTNSN